MLDRVKDWMTTNPVTADVCEDVKVVADTMNKNVIRHLLVRDAGQLIGVVSGADLRLVDSILSKFNTDERREANITVGDLATRAIFSVDEHAPISEAMKMMQDKHVHCLPVSSSKGETVGILTWTDIVRYGIAAAQQVKSDNERKTASK